MNMAMVNIGYMNLLLKFLSVVGTRKILKLEDPTTWDNARNNCQQKGEILAPPHLDHLPADGSTYKRTMWTSNYILKIGCVACTEYCTALKVEKELMNATHYGLCQNGNDIIRTKLQAEHMRVCASDKLVSITGMKTLYKINNKLGIKEVERDKTIIPKVWIHSIKDNITGFVRKCEVYNKFSNRSKLNDWNLTYSDCEEEHQYGCIEETNYGTLISEILLPPPALTTTVHIQEGKHREVQYGTPKLYITGIISIVAIVIGLIILGCLIRRWFIKIKKQLLEALRQKYDHQMYDVEHMEPESDNLSELPVSPGGSSLYENVDNAHDFSREANLTVSYMTSREIQRPVTVPSNGTTTRQGTLPRLSIPSRLPSRGNAVRHKPDRDHSSSRLKPIRKGRVPSKVTTLGTSTVSQDTDVATPSRFDDEVSVPQIRAPFSLPSQQKPSPKPDIKDLTLKYKTNATRKKGDTIIHETSSSAFALYINTGRESIDEDPDVTDEGENYENIWLNN